MNRETIKGYRIVAGYKQKDFADMFGISKQSFSQKERGITRFTKEEMITIRDVVRKVIPNVTIDDIFFS